MVEEKRRLTFTDTWVRAVTLPANGRAEYYDEKTRGLALRVSPKGDKYPRGLKTWYAIYRVKGRSAVQRMKLGRYSTDGSGMSLADAREATVEAVRSASKGLDPVDQVKAERAADTFGELADLYIQRHALGEGGEAKPRKRTWKQDRRYVDVYLKPRLKNIRALSVTQDDITAVIEKYRANAPIMANRIHDCARRIYSWATGRKIDGRLLLPANTINPAKGIERSEEKQRDRVLTEPEIAAVLHGLEAETPARRAMFKLRLLTAARGQEVGALRGKDLADELHGPVWTIPAEIAKMGKAVRLPLSKQAVDVLLDYTGKATLAEIIRDMPDRLFAKVETYSMTIAKIMRRLREASGVAFVPHDLRRSAASIMADLGASRVVVAMLLGHKTGRQHGGGLVTAIYDRAERLDERREAIQKLADHIDAIRKKHAKPGDVLPMKAAL